MTRHNTPIWPSSVGADGPQTERELQRASEGGDRKQSAAVQPFQLLTRERVVCAAIVNEKHQSRCNVIDSHVADRNLVQPVIKQVRGRPEANGRDEQANHGDSWKIEKPRHATSTHGRVVLWKCESEVQEKCRLSGNVPQCCPKK